jgi:phosphoenolpyruvate-protein kinase (PTS system EI component)
VGVCGELASDLTAVPVLVGLGITELSANAPAIPAVKQAVRGLNTDAAHTLAHEALRLSSATEVRTLVEGQSVKPAAVSTGSGT